MIESTTTTKDRRSSRNQNLKLKQGVLNHNLPAAVTLSAMGDTATGQDTAEKKDAEIAGLKKEKECSGQLYGPSDYTDNHGQLLSCAFISSGSFSRFCKNVPW